MSFFFFFKSAKWKQNSSNVILHLKDSQHWLDVKTDGSIQSWGKNWLTDGHQTPCAFSLFTRQTSDQIQILDVNTRHQQLLMEASTIPTDRTNIDRVLFLRSREFCQGGRDAWIWQIRLKRWMCLWCSMGNPGVNRIWSETSAARAKSKTSQGGDRGLKAAGKTEKTTTCCRTWGVWQRWMCGYWKSKGFLCHLWENSFLGCFLLTSGTFRFL